MNKNKVVELRGQLNDFLKPFGEEHKVSVSQVKMMLRWDDNDDHIR